MSNKGGRVSPDYLADIAPEYAEDFKQSSEYVAGQNINKSDYEKFNQRFLIHIVPVIGNIKMND